jgi:tetratricopeptide (TPR) repeat protein
MLAIAHSGREALEWNLRGIALAEASQNQDARNWLGTLYNNTGWTYHDDFQEYEKALELFERGVRFRTERQQKKETNIAHWCVARALRSLKRYDEALAIQQRLLAEHAADGTEDGFVHEELAECLLALGLPANVPRHAALAHEKLSQVSWFVAESPDRLARLAGIAAGTITK